MSTTLTEVPSPEADCAPTSWITTNDLQRSATATMLGDFRQSLKPIARNGCHRILDIGCGFGGLTKFVGDYFGAAEVHGIDTDARALREAVSKGVIAHRVNVSQEPLPFPDSHLDLVFSLGMFDFLPYFDDMIREVLRVVRPGGHALVSLPNLASWHNRLFLLMGYQPRDVEVSRETLVGVHPYYRRDPKPTGHIHTTTTRAFRELMEFHGFRTVSISAGRPNGRRKAWAPAALDAVLSLSPRLARRFFYLGVKPELVLGQEDSERIGRA
jgi:SAM-dependent methyltransferase